MQLSRKLLSLEPYCSTPEVHQIPSRAGSWINILYLLTGPIGGSLVRVQTDPPAVRARLWGGSGSCCRGGGRRRRVWSVRVVSYVQSVAGRPDRLVCVHLLIWCVCKRAPRSMRAPASRVHACVRPAAKKDIDRSRQFTPPVTPRHGSTADVRRCGLAIEVLPPTRHGMARAVGRCFSGPVSCLVPRKGEL